MVNAKNLFGGYVGDRAFMGSFEASQPKVFKVAEWWGGDPAKDHLDVLELCANMDLLLH